MLKPVWDLYYFIHYIEVNEPLEGEQDFIPLNGIGYLYIGTAEWHPDVDSGSGNCFLTIDAAREALHKIKEALNL